MAEILGLASSIITVVGVAGKLGTSTIRLKRLWDEVQDVPSSIRRCIEQLDLLAPAIEEMDTEFQKTRDMVQHDSAAKRSLEYSQKAVETLETLVRDMEKHINSERKSKRLLAQLKVRVKKEVIEEQQQQLNFALQLVSLSQQTYLMALSRAQPLVIISEIKSWQESERQRHMSSNPRDEDQGLEVIETEDRWGNGGYASSVSTVPASAWWTAKRTMPWQNTGFLGSFSYQSYELDVNTTFPHRLAKTRVHQARLRLPWWMIQKVWDFQILRASGGWTIQLRNWTTRPDDSAIFRYVLYGQTESVLEAIASNEASLYDRNSQGETLLELAALTFNLELVKVLISIGLSIANVELDYLFSCLVVWSWSEAKMSQAIEFGQVVRDEIGFVTRVGNHNIVDDCVLENALWPPTIWGVKGFWKQIFSSAHDMIKLAGPLDWIFTDPEVLLELLGEHLVPAATLRRQPLPARLTDFAWRYFHDFLNQAPEMDHWRLLARKLFVGAFPEGITFPEDWQSPDIIGIITKLWQRQFPLRPFEQWLKKILKMWLEDLAEAGVNLGEYIRSEAIYNRGHGSTSRYWLRGEFAHPLRLWEGMRLSESGPSLVIQSLGPAPDDWVCSWDPCVEELSGEFWTTITYFHLTMPGAWVDDVEDVRRDYRPQCQMRDDNGCSLRPIAVSHQGRRESKNPPKIRGMGSCWSDEYSSLFQRVR